MGIFDKIFGTPCEYSENGKKMCRSDTGLLSALGVEPRDCDDTCYRHSEDCPIFKAKKTGTGQSRWMVGESRDPNDPNR